MELNWFIIYLFLWFYLRINSLWTALTALRTEDTATFPCTALGYVMTPPGILPGDQRRTLV